MRKHLLTVSELLRKTEFRLALISVLLLSLIPLNFGRYDRVVGAIADAGHFWFYFIVFFYLERVSSRPKRLLLGLIFIAGLIEVIQPYVDRDGNFQDFAVSSLGAICGFFCRQKFQPLLKILVTALCAVPLFFPIYWRIEALRFQEKLFPEFAVFSDSGWMNLWEPTAPDKGPSSTLYIDPKGMLVVRAIATKVYPGVMYLNQFLSWDGYQNLEIEIEAFQDETLSFRIDDDGDCREFNNRFNKAYLVKKGRTLIQISFDEIKMTLSGRIMNLSKIKRVAVFTSGREKAERVFAVKSMRLTR